MYIFSNTLYTRILRCKIKILQKRSYNVTRTVDQILQEISAQI